MRGGIRQAVLRTAWLLVGAAIGLAAILLLGSLAAVVGPTAGAGQRIVLILCLLPALLLGLLPGVRELEVTAARAMLGVRSDLVVPSRPRAAHRWRTAALVTFHLAAGLVAAVFLVGLVPGAIVLTAASLAGRSEWLAGVPVRPLPGAAAVLLGVLALAGCLVVAWLLGRTAAGVASRLLGPTPQDRLEVALARLDAESEHTRLARELHDGIGHALTIIGVQAAAGRRTVAANPQQAGNALGRIETTARQALDELDGMLSVLRDGAAPPRAEPDLARLPALLDAYRSAGMPIAAEVAPVSGLPQLVSSTAYRIVAEALANAQRYAGAGSVSVRLVEEAGQLIVTVASPLPASPRPSRERSGRGLIGITERVALFGGRLHAGPQQSTWLLRAEIPRGSGGG